MHLRVETGSAHPGQKAHPGNVLTGSSGSKLVYKIFKCDPNSKLILIMYINSDIW